MEMETFRPVLALLAAACGAVAVGSLVGQMAAELGISATAKTVGGFLGKAPESTPFEQLGERLLKLRIFRSASAERHLRWIALEEPPPSMARLLGMAITLAVMVAGAALLLGVPALFALAAICFAYPFVKVRSRANRVRDRVRRSLPELAALMAAEIAAGRAPDRAFEQAAEWGGPLAALVREVVAAAARSNRPVFSRGAQRGVITHVFGRYDMPQLRAFASQLDQAASKGAAGPELMVELARGQVLEYKARALANAESLDNQLAIPAVLFFFLPFIFIILYPLLLPVLNAL